MPALASGVMMPYPGMRPFRTEDWDLFYGQEEAIDALGGLLREHRFVAVMGESGCGKSSIVQAGLIPALTGFGRKRRGSEPQWRICATKPRGAPIAELARQLSKAGLATESSGPSFWHSHCLLDCARTNLQDGQQLLLVVDQFEELFRFHREAKKARDEDRQDEAALFVKMLLATQQVGLPEVDRVPVCIVLTMRSEYFGDCAAFAGLAEAVNAGSLLLPKMSRTQLEEAIVEPAAHCGLGIENELLQHLLNETEQAREDGLPLLQHALRRTWEAWRKHDATHPLLRSRDFQLEGEIPGDLDIEKHLNAHLDEIFLGLSKADQLTASRLFKLLGEFDHKARLIRRPCFFGEALDATGAASKDDLLRVVNAFRDEPRGRTFLSPPRPEPAGGDSQQTEDGQLLDGQEPLDLVHEAILRRWHKCSTWTKEETEDAKTYQELVSMATKAGATPLHGRQLANATIWWKEFQPTERWALRYGDAAAYEKTRRHFKRSWRLRWVRWLGGAAAFFVVFAALFWLQKRNIEQTQKAKMAETEKQTAAAIANTRAIADADALKRQTAATEALAKAKGQLDKANTQLSAKQAQLTIALGRSSVEDAAVLLDAQNRQGMARLAKALRDDYDSVAARSWISSELAQQTWWLPAARLQHQRAVKSAAFSADGRRVVTASDDETARVWDAETGKPVGLALQHKGRVHSTVFSADGRRVVTASDDATAQVWDAETGKPVGLALQHKGAVHSAAFSADARRVVTASEDKTARVWDAETGKPVGLALQHQGPVHSAAFSSDGRRVVTASFDKTAQVWDAETGKPTGLALQHHEQVYSAAFSADGRRVVTASWDHTAQVWDAETGKRIGRALRHQGQVNSAAFSADGRLVVTASGDNTAQVWDAESGERVGLALQHHEQVYSAAFSADGRRVVTASGDNTAQVWDAESGERVGLALQHHEQVYSAAFSADGRRVVTASEDKTARVWDADTGKPVGLALQHQNSAALSADGRRVVTASDDKTARVWDAETGKPVGFALHHQEQVHSAAFSANGRRVVTASYDKTAQVWDTDTGKPIGRALQHNGTVKLAAFSANGRRVVTASWDKTAQVWDAETGKPIGLALQHADIVNSAAFSADGRRVVTASDDKTARVWDAETGKPVGLALQHNEMVVSAAFSADGRRVVTACLDGTAQVWDAETGKPVGPALQHQGAVLSAAFSADGRRVVTASSDHTAQVWDAETGKPVGLALQHGWPVNSAAFSADGRRVVTASSDGTARVWDAETGKPVGPALQHHGKVFSAAFSADGRRVVAVSEDKTARVWDVLFGMGSSQDAAFLADAAELAGGYRVNEFGSIVPVDDPLKLRADLWKRLAGLPDEPRSVAWFLRRFLPPPPSGPR